MIAKILCLPSNICSLKMLKNLHLFECSKFVNLPENLRNLESLFNLSLRGIAIELLPSSVGRLTALRHLNLSDCENLLCLPESISQLSRITRLNLDGCKRLRWLPDIRSQDCNINVNNCTTLERFPESPKNCPFWCRHFDFCVACVNCFNIQFCVKVFLSLFSKYHVLGKLPNTLLQYISIYLAISVCVLVLIFYYYYFL